MSQIEVNSGARIEVSGGSFSRNVQMMDGERNDGLGMRWSTPGEVFPLRAVLEDAKNAGTSLAPGTFEAIFIRTENEIIRVDYEECVAGMDKDGLLTIKMYTDEFLQDPEFANIIIDGNRFKEVVLRKWGRFTSFDAPDYPLNPNMLYPVPQTTIEQEYYERSRRVTPKL